MGAIYGWESGKIRLSYYEAGVVFEYGVETVNGVSTQRSTHKFYWLPP
jgi:hypothetical protein